MQDLTSEATPANTYPPLAEIRKSLRVRWYRCPIEPATLRSLLKRSDALGAMQAGGHLALWLLSATFVTICFVNAWWWWMPAALFLHGSVASFFHGTSVHELGHATVFKTPWLNKLFLYAFSTLSWWDPFDYASSHTFHHRYTLHPDGDRENLLPLSPLAGKTFLLQMLTFNLYSPPGRTFGKGGFINTVAATVRGAFGQTGNASIPSNAWLAALHENLPDEHQKSIRWSRWLLLFHGTVLLVSLLSGQWIAILIISCGSFFAKIWSYLLGMTQHCGLKENDSDFRKCVRSIRINPLLEFLYWRMNWHTEHHMFAGVPCYRLKALHRAVEKDMPAPRTLREAWLEMIETWERQKTDPEYYYDTPLPTTAGHTGAIEHTADQSTLGDLAPAALKDKPSK
jgi:fatty acid desaturase